MFSIPAPKNDSHTYGSLVTYCRRFSLQSIVGIPAEDDDGNAAAQASKSLVNDGQIASIKALMEMTDTQESQFLKAYNVSNMKQLTTDQFKNAAELLEKKRQKMSEAS
jgi:hypothetical protein